MRDEWDLPRLSAWFDYLGDHPPVQMMVAAYLGIKPRATQSTNNEDVLGQLLAIPGLSSP